MTLRTLRTGIGNTTVETLARGSKALDARVSILMTREEGLTDCSTVAVAMMVARDGASSWKIHFMEMVDEFRRSWRVWSSN
jgi:hypothetical protein